MNKKKVLLVEDDQDMATAVRLRLEANGYEVVTANDGMTGLEIAPSISEGLVKNDLPQKDTTETKNKVLVKDGQSVVIGGLTKSYNRETIIGVPFLSAIPILGAAFRRTELNTEKRDVMVIITPHIVTPDFLSMMEKKADELNTNRAKWVKDKAKLLN
jgi:type II secretory pathway component GspD/PulD (secretin)